MVIKAAQIWQQIRVYRKEFGLLVYLVFCLFAFYLDSNPWGTYRVAPEKVWSKIQEVATEKDLDPHLVYAIAWAESSLNAHAQTEVARGLMQVTRDAWDRVAMATWRDAYDWKINLETACAYLETLREELQEALDSEPTTAQLAGAYRYGFTGLKACGFDATKLPETNNKIYQKLFAGDSVAVLPPED